MESLLNFIQRQRWAESLYFVALASHSLLCLSRARFVYASLHELLSRSLTVESDLLFVGVLSGFLALAVGPFFLLLC